MQSRVVAIPLIAAICLGSPALASSPEEQMVNGRGARDRNGGSTSGGNSGGSAERPSGSGERRDGGSTSTTTARSGNERRGDSGGQQRAAVRRGDDNRDREATRVVTRDDNRDDNRADDQRIAVRRTPDRNRGYNPPVIVRNSRPNININIGNSFRPRFYSPFYYDRWARSYYRWSPIGYAPWSLIYGSIGFSNFGAYSAYGAYGAYAPYAPYAQYAPYSYDLGGVRLKIRPRDAQVFVDGYYAGIVDDFDGTFQSLRLEAGGHKIEIHMPGFEDLELDVHVQPGRTITLEEILRPRP
jgi:hypothetical protein